MGTIRRPAERSFKRFNSNVVVGSVPCALN
jgi:hypothetical protein